MLTCMLSERNRRPISNGDGRQATVREAETSIIVATSTMPRADMYTCHQHTLISLTQTLKDSQIRPERARSRPGASQH